MYRVLIVLALLSAPVLGQAQENNAAYAAPVFSDPVEGRPFQARYTIKRSWTSPGNEYSETETGSFFRDARGRLSMRQDPGGECDWMQGCVWIQDPVTDRFFRGLGPDGKPQITKLSSALNLDFQLGDWFLGGDHQPYLGSRYRRLWFNLPRPAVLPAEEPKSLGPKLIQGLHCEGFVLERPDRIPGGYTVEYWVSNEIQRIVYQRITANDTIQVYRLHDIERVDPPESLFMIPQQ
jgi:hypothetical protein